MVMIRRIERRGLTPALAQLKQQGLIAFRPSGFSRQDGKKAAMRALETGDCAMSKTYNLAGPERAPGTGNFARHTTRDLIKKALASGHLCLQVMTRRKRAWMFVFAHPRGYRHYRTNKTPASTQNVASAPQSAG